MPEEVLNQRSENSEGSSPTPPSEEWISLREAARILNLTSTRQIRRRLKVENWRSRLIRLGGIIKRQVHSDDVATSKQDVIDDVIADVTRNPESSTRDVIDKSHSSHRVDVIAMSQVVKDFLAVANSIKDKFDGMIESQYRIAETQHRMAEAQDKALNIAEKEVEIGERRFKHEKVRSVIWLILFVVVAGLLTAGGYYGYRRLVGYYKAELSLREKEIGLLDGVYNRLLEKHEEELGRKDSEIEKLKEKAEARDSVSTEGEGLER